MLCFSLQSLAGDDDIKNFEMHQVDSPVTYKWQCRYGTYVRVLITHLEKLTIGTMLYRAMLNKSCEGSTK